MQGKKAKERFEHIWEYYKMDFLSLLAIFLMIWALNNPSVFAEPPPTVNIYEVNRSTNDDEIEEKVAAFYASKKELGATYEVYYDGFIRFSIDNPGLLGFEYMTKMVALFAANEIDLLISDPSIIEHYGKQGGFLDLEEVLPSIIQDKWKEDFVYIENQYGEIYAFAVRLRINNEKLAAIPVNSENKEKSIDALTYLQNGRN